MRSRTHRMPMGMAAALAVALVLAAGGARAQTDPEPVTEQEPDPTRLDVERVPPEAIEVTRDLYAHGLFIEAGLGGRGFVGGVGRFSDPGLYMTFGLGYELLRWLWLKATVEGSIHTTDAPAPPSRTAFEVLGVLGEVRLQLDVTPRVALWAGAEAGVMHVMSDVLKTYGFDQADDFGLIYGGQAGVDWHMLTRHHSLGIAAGARMYPPLDGPDGETAIGVRGNVYLRYVF